MSATVSTPAMMNVYAARFRTGWGLSIQRSRSRTIPVCTMYRWVCLRAFPGAR